MNRSKIRIIAIFTVIILILSGCTPGNASFKENLLKAMLGTGEVVSYDDMVYKRPDPDDVMDAYNKACEASEGYDAEYILECVFDYYDEYDWFYTYYSLADLKYCHDLTDEYWEDECNFFAENIPQVDASLENLYYELAESPCRDQLEEEFFGEGYFEAYDGENLWDDELNSLLTKEAQLQNEYYDISEESSEYEFASDEYYDACADELAELLIDLVNVRQDIAQYWGYDDYTQFANNYYYARDYDSSDVEAYLADISKELSPLYSELFDSDVWNAAYSYASEKETLRYLEEAADNMGGEINMAFKLMQTAGLYDISYGENKYGSAFEVYLTSYAEPFIFMNSSLIQADKLTLVHEFGHFCNDFLSYGSYAGADVAEIFSQGMEYLSLCYTEDSEELMKYKMADSLCTYVEQAAYADFELKLYSLLDDELTVDNLRDIYEDIAEDYGFESVGYDNREFVGISHYYTHPMYVISYVLSNDAAMQIYEMELDRSGKGKKLFTDNIDTEESYFMAFLDDAGLKSPFSKGRIDSVKALFEDVLQ
ncbi:MAG: hypothetical protein E7218_03250 [Anaerofustis stercorihominis]|nr:hypothetical protein [Anaerofustis stercorihominis]